MRFDCPRIQFVNYKCWIGWTIAFGFQSRGKWSRLHSHFWSASFPFTLPTTPWYLRGWGIFFNFAMFDTGVFLKNGFQVSVLTRGVGTLYDFIYNFRPQRPPVAQILIWVHQIALGLGYMHRMGICHLDLKLQNLVYFQGNVQSKAYKSNRVGYHVKVSYFHFL